MPIHPTMKKKNDEAFGRMPKGLNEQHESLSTLKESIGCMPMKTNVERTIDDYRRSNLTKGSLSTRPKKQKKNP